MSQNGAAAAPGLPGAEIDCANTKSMAFSKFKEIDRQLANVPGTQPRAPVTAAPTAVQSFAPAHNVTHAYGNLTSTTSIAAMASAAQSEADSMVVTVSRTNSPKPQPVPAPAPVANERVESTNAEEPSIRVESVVSSAFAMFQKIGGTAAAASVARPARKEPTSQAAPSTAMASGGAKSSNVPSLPAAATVVSGPPPPKPTTQPVTAQKPVAALSNAEPAQAPQQPEDQEIYSSKAALFRKFQEMDATTAAASNQPQRILAPSKPAPRAPGATPAQSSDTPVEAFQAPPMSPEVVVEASADAPPQPQSACVSQERLENVEQSADKIVQAQELEALDEMQDMPYKPATRAERMSLSISERKKVLEQDGALLPGAGFMRSRSPSEVVPRAANDTEQADSQEPSFEQQTTTRHRSTKTNMNMLAAVLSATSSGEAVPAGPRSAPPRYGPAETLTGVDSPTVAPLESPSPVVAPLQEQPQQQLTVQTPTTAPLETESARKSPKKAAVGSGKEKGKDSGPRSAFRIATSIARRILLPKKEPVTVISASQLSSVGASEASIAAASTAPASPASVAPALVAPAPAPQPLPPMATPAVERRQSVNPEPQPRRQSVNPEPIVQQCSTNPEPTQPAETVAWEQTHTTFDEPTEMVVFPSEDPTMDTNADLPEHEENSTVEPQAPTGYNRTAEQEAFMRAMQQSFKAAAAINPVVLTSSAQGSIEFPAVDAGHGDQPDGGSQVMRAMHATMLPGMRAPEAGDGSASGTNFVTRAKRSESSIMRPCLPDAVNSDLIAKMQARLNASTAGPSASE